MKISASTTFHDFSQKNTTEIADIFSVNIANGLLNSEIEKRRKLTGLNVLEESNVRPLKILLRQFKSSFIYLLLAATILSFFLGQVTEGVMVLIFLFINASLGFYQEYRSEQTVLLLKRYAAPRTKVRREGKIITIDSQELVLGDVVIIEAGDNVPADIRIVSSSNLAVNEEPLTGESVPIKKESAAIIKGDVEMHEAKNICFSGTTIVSGRGEGVVFSTGGQTVIGGISRLTGQITRASNFEQELGKFSQYILYLVIGTLAFIFVANIALKGFSTDIAALAIFSIALAVSVVPEALPLVMTFSLSRGARRLAKEHVVVKRLSSIEDLGGIEVLCTDKTGTLTENRLTVHSTYNSDSLGPIFGGSLGGNFLITKERGGIPDSFDIALWEALTHEEQMRLSEWTRLADSPFDPIHKKNSVLLQKESAKLLIVRGAPETIVSTSLLSPEEQGKILAWVEKEGQSGRRVLAVASKVASNEVTEISDESSLTFIGCISFNDPIKQSATKSIKAAQTLGVRIKILTGDSKEVAGTVAFEVGLVKDPHDVLTAKEFFDLDEETQELEIERTNVFARVSPEQKYRLIEILQKKYRVGFLGEGINDAPALKIANVAIVVQGASDIAREASDIILLEQSLSAIVGGIREGRAIFANTVKYIQSSLSSNFGNFYSIAISSLFINFLPMLPLQILLVNLLSDFPAIAVATDTVDDSALKTPRKYNVRKLIAMGTVLGIVSTIFDFIIFASFYKVSPGALQTHWFIASILTELLFLFSIRSRSFFFKTKAPSFTLIILSLLAASATIIIPFTEFGASLFSFIRPTASSITFVLGVVIIYFITTELAKIAYYRITTPSNNMI